MILAIRTPSIADAPQLYSLIRHHASFERSTASLTVLELETIIICDRPPVRLLVADHRGAIVGYAAVTFDWSLWRARPYAHLDSLFVSEDFRGNGVGAMLFNAAVRLTSEEPADRLEWQTPAWNDDAIRFYVRRGAESADKKRFALMVNHSD